MVQQNSIMVPEQVYSSVPKSPLSPSAPPVADPRFSPMPSGRSLQILDTASSSYSHLSTPPNSASPYSYNSHPFGYSMQNDQSLGAVSRLDVADSPSVFPERHHRSFSTASSSVSDYPGPASYDFGPAYVPSTTGNPPMLPLPRVNSFPQANAPAQIPPMPYSGQTGYYYPYSPHPQAFPRQSSENIA